MEQLHSNRALSKANTFIYKMYLDMRQPYMLRIMFINAPQILVYVNNIYLKYIELKMAHGRHMQNMAIAAMIISLNYNIKRYTANHNE